MNQLVGGASKHTTKIKKQVRDKTTALEDVKIPTSRLSIGECLTLCKAHSAGDDAREHVCGRVTDLLEQLKQAGNRQCVSAIAAYCTCLDLLWTSLLNRPSGGSLSASGSTTVPGTFEDDLDKLPEKLDFLIDSRVQFSRDIDSTHTWTRMAETITRLVVEEGTAVHPWLIPRHELLFDKQIGSGSFATVWRGKWADTLVVMKHMASNIVKVPMQYCKSVANLWTRLTFGSS